MNSKTAKIIGVIIVVILLGFVLWRRFFKKAGTPATGNTTGTSSIGTNNTTATGSTQLSGTPSTSFNDALTAPGQPLPVTPPAGWTPPQDITTTTGSPSSTSGTGSTTSVTATPVTGLTGVSKTMDMTQPVTTVTQTTFTANM